MFAEIFLNRRQLNSDGTFTYEVPASLKSSIKIGQWVTVPLRKQTVFGLVISLHGNRPAYYTKPIFAIEKTYPALSETHIKMAIFIKKYYRTSLYKSLSLFLPAKLWKDPGHIPYESCLVLNQPIEVIADNIKKIRSSEQKNILEELIAKKKLDAIEQKKYSTKSIKNLFKTNLTTYQSGELKNPWLEKIPTAADSIPNPNIEKKIPDDQHPILLFSGLNQTEKLSYYKWLIERSLKNQEQILLLVPDIHLVKYFFNYLSPYYRDQIGFFHSEFLDTQKHIIWHRIHQSKTNCLIGSRASLFLPWQNLKLIIVDQEHDSQYKQEQAPRYNARDVALKYSQIAQSRVILVSRSPSLESWHRSSSGAYQLQKNEARNSQIIKTVDLRQEIKAGNFSMLSESLTTEMQMALNEKKKILLFLNRRGQASSVICRDCGYICQCQKCNLPLTYHKTSQSTGFLLCHHCGTNYELKVNCPRCSSLKIRYLRAGIQKLETEVQNLFPQAKIVRLDTDTVKQQKKIGQKNPDLPASDILISTQIIKNKPDLLTADLVAILLADIGLHIPDFRSSEKALQLFLEIIGGGQKLPEKVIIQSYQPDHAVIKAIANQTEEEFMATELLLRKQLQNPPFSQIIKLSLQDPSPKQAKFQATIVSKNLIQLANKLDYKLEIYALAALYPKIQNHYRYNIIIKGQNPAKLLDKITLERAWKVDVDPTSVIS